MKTSQLNHLAKLANLELTPGETKKLAQQLEKTLDFVSQIESLKTKKVKATSQVTGLKNVFREDEPKPSLSAEAVLKNAKGKQGNFFRIKGLFKWGN